MKSNFEIIPYVGAEPLRFGMTEDKVIELVENPVKVTTNGAGEKSAFYDDFSVRYSIQNGGLVEIGFLKSAHVSFRGLDIFGEPDVFRKILRMDSCPYECFGFIVLLDLGITLSGFHDNDESQLAVTAFVRGRWDGLRNEFKIFRCR